MDTGSAMQGPQHDGGVGQRNRQRILAAAERVFARQGFRGARLAEIAEAAGVPKSNLLYYFRTKETLYRALIADILDTWLCALGEISADDDPAEALALYIRRKMVLSRSRPDASRVFATEVIAGAPVIGEYLRTDLRAWVARHGKVFRVWQRRGLMAPRAPEHVFFMIWAVTQTYADFDAQVKAVLGTDEVDERTFRVAVRTVTDTLLAGLGMSRGQERGS